MSNRTSMESKLFSLNCTHLALPWSQCLIEPVWNQNADAPAAQKDLSEKVSMSNRTSMESKLLTAP